MTFTSSAGLHGMSDDTRPPTTLSNIGVAMFAVADQDEALAFYTEKLGFEVSVTRASVSTARCVGWKWPRRGHGPGWRSTRRWAVNPAAA
jgi:hypothetical protein